MKKIVLLVLTFCAGTLVFAQNGYLRGKITDQVTGEELIGATVIQKGTTKGAVTDFNGDFSLSLEPGTHTVMVQFVSFEPVTIEGVVIKAGEVTSLDVTLSEDVQQLESVVVSAEQIKDNDVAILAVQRKSANTLDGISSASFKKIGDNNLSTAMNRVTGVTVQGGKYVYVRGLGDRYTKTALNGMVIPGLDPDRNDVQIDIFPTAILENVMVYKTFTPDLVGDFSGGLVDIQTKAFPVDKSTSVNIGFGYNPSMHFKSDAVTYDGSSTDFLGWDSGDRKLPISKNAVIPTTPNDYVAELTRKFSSQLGTKRSTNFMNSNFYISHRNQVQKEKLTWGYNLIFNYRNTNTLYRNYTRNRYENDRTSSEVSLVRDYSSSGDMGMNEVLWSALATLAAKTSNTTIGTSFLHIQNGTSTALDREMSYSSLNNPTHIYNDILAYMQQTMSNNITYGKHSFGKWRLDWTNSLLYTTNNTPDYRDTRINKDDGELKFANGGSMDRFWRELNEISETAKVDVTFNVNNDNKIKFGGFYNYRDREFNMYSYSYAPLSTFDIEENDANWLLQEENLYSSDNPDGLYIQDNSNDYNDYKGNLSLVAGYAMDEMQVTQKLKTIYGVRVESVTMHYSGVRRAEDGSTQEENNTKTLDKTNLLPSVNLVYALREDMNLRGSFNKTLARPSFREKSSVFLEDPILNQQFSGNLDLKQAEILNYDLRWEWFLSPAEMLSVSGFYKDFTNHIALVFFPSVSGQVKPRNVGEASVYGTEVEFRKSLQFISTDLKDFSLGSNVSIVFSRVNRKTVTVDESGQNEYDAEVDYVGSENGVDKYRKMTGQSPVVINGFLNYQNDRLGLTGNVSYNVQTETLSIIGIGTVPSVYTKPFNSLNMKVSKSLGANRRSSLSLTIRNLLDDDRLMVYKNYGEEKVFNRYEPGRQFSVNYTYTF